MSCTSTTTKVAQAISLMSDVLSAEVAVAQHILDAEENDRIECADDHEELKNLANDFATENQEGLEEVQSDLQTAVGIDDDDPYYSFDDGDPGHFDPEDEDDEARDSDNIDDADKAEPTDEEKIEALEDKIAEHEQTIKDLKNTMETALDNIDTLVTAAETFRDQVEEY